MSAPENNGGDATMDSTTIDQRNAGPVLTGPKTSNVNQAAETALRLSKLEELCSVLGINYAGRLKELGIKEGKGVNSEAYLSLCETVITLTGIRENRFNQLQSKSLELIKLWKSSFRDFSKGVDLSQLYSVADARSAADINSEKFLSTTWLDQVEVEIRRFEAAAMAKYKDKYRARKKKLMELTKLTHLLPMDVTFDPSVIVPDNMYKSEARSIKEKIKELKPAVLERKELVFRVEQAKMAINERQSTMSIDVLIERARKVAEEIMTKSKKDLKYDGHHIHTLLGNLLSVTCSLQNNFEEELHQNAEITLTRPRTRSGSAQVASRQLGCMSNTQRNVANSGAKKSLDDWSTKDKRISHLTFNVTNLLDTISYYTDCFGMQVLSQFQQNDKDYAFLGFNPEQTTLQLIYKHEDDDGRQKIIGGGFGHVSLKNTDVRKIAKTVEVSRFGRLVNKPCRLDGCTTVIAFASDPNEILFELIQNSPESEPVSRLMLYADDIDRSINFYEKALGMRVLKKKDNQRYKMVCMSFEAEEKSTLLEFRTSDDARSVDQGEVYCQMVIETRDLQKSFDILKEEISKHPLARILQEPTDNMKMCSFVDPDGWKGVLIDHADPDKHKHIL